MAAMGFHFSFRPGLAFRSRRSKPAYVRVGHVRRRRARVAFDMLASLSSVPDKANPSGIRPALAKNKI